MVAVAITLDENPEIREEDFAAAYMGIQNLSLVAHAMGLGTHLKTGAIMDDPAARAAVGLPEGERIVATINIGEPDGLPDGKARQPARNSRRGWSDLGRSSLEEQAPRGDPSWRLEHGRKAMRSLLPRWSR